MSRVWFITGCSTGFGKLLAKKLLAAGESVVATARNVEQLGDLLPSDPARLLTYPLDVTRGEQIDHAATCALDTFGRVDVLVNNAGYGYFSTVEEGDVDEFRRDLETNVVGLFRVTKALLPSMRERGAGAIVNLSSIAGRVAFPRAAFYNATKWAVEGFSEALYHEVASFGIRVLVIEPGSYDTDFGPRSAVRSLVSADPTSPYAGVGKLWTDAARKAMPEKQDPMEVVDGIIEAVNGGESFARFPFGRDARALVDQRASMSDADFVATMNDRYYRA
jgi:NAD(P)-dependent dehydrogenase (short-subunit alcohol dehydrogenase family)